MAANRLWTWCARWTLAGTVASAAAGCTHVAPYERERLAHSSMTTADVARSSEDHVRAVQEGAIGGDASAGGGCGCN